MPDSLHSLRDPRRFGEDFQPLALDETALDRTHAPTAFSLLDLLGADVPATTLDGDVAIVRAEGPLDTRGSWLWDGYDTVTARVREALDSEEVRAVVLALDSPGGVAAGMLDGARALRAAADAAADAAGKPLVAWAGTQACSAAYGLACACDAIVVTSDGEVGSVGVVARVYDRTKQNEMDGLNVRVVRSGTLKADPHPDVPLTDASVARVRARVMELAGMFGAWVTSRRPQLGDPLNHQGATFMGQRAVETGFADAVGTLADAITTARQMADAQDAMKNTNTTTDPQTHPGAVALATLRGQLAAASDDELIAAVSTLQKTAALVPDLQARVAAAEKALAERDAADLKAAHQAVLDKHVARGALTKADLDDAEYMATLHALDPKAADKILSRRPGLPTTPVQPRKVSAIDPGAAPAGDDALSPEDLEWAKSTGVAPAAILAARKDEQERAARRR